MTTFQLLNYTHFVDWQYFKELKQNLKTIDGLYLIIMNEIKFFHFKSIPCKRYIVVQAARALFNNNYKIELIRELIRRGDRGFRNMRFEYFIDMLKRSIVDE